MKTPVILRGITLKGSNRINEHGSCWFRHDHTSGFDGRVMYEAMNTGYLKWGPRPDFEDVNLNDE